MYTPANIYSGWENDIISDRLSCTLIYLGSRGTQHVETTVPPESIVQSSTTIRENICSSRFEIGQAISRQLDLKLIGQGWPLSYSEVTLSQIFTLPDREVTFPLGTYIVYAPSVRKNSTHTTLTAYDYLLKADKVITATNADKFTGSNLWDIFSFAAGLCDITLGFSQSDISGYANYAELPNWDGTNLSGYDLSKAVAMGATCRDLLASAAALIGCSLKIDRVTNRLMLVRFIPTEPVYTINKFNAIDRDINEQYAVANLVSYGKYSGVRFGSLPPSAVVDEADLSLGTNVLLPDNSTPHLPLIMQQALDGTQTGIGGTMKLYNIDIKWFGYPGLEAGDYVTTEQEWLNTQSLDFFIMENVYKPHSPCTMRSFGEASSNIYTNALTEPGRFSRANITTTKDVIEHVTPWEEDPIEEEATIYGWHVDPSISNPAQAITYLGDAVGKTPAAMGASTFSYGSWENAFFMPKPCMLRSDGTVAYYLDPNDYTKKTDGTASDVANSSFDGNAMMEWPLIWYKFEAGETEGEGYFYCSNKHVDSSYKCWCNYDSQNNIIPYFYTAIYNGTGTSKLRSLSGVQLTPANGNGMTNSNVETARASANNTRAGVSEWNVHTWSDRTLINALIVLITKCLDSQLSIGKGISSGGQSAKEAYVTGALNDKGLFYGDVSGTSTAVKVFGMENWWGCVWNRITGLNGSSETEKCLYKLTSGTIDGSSTEGYNTTGNGYLKAGIFTTDNTHYCHIKKMSFGKHGMLPVSADVIGSDSSISGWYCDAFYGPSGALQALVGGGSGQNNTHIGCFDLSIGAGPDFSAWYISASLSCKPVKRG